MPYTIFMTWKVYFSEKASKQAKKQGKRIISILDLLMEDLKQNGPAPGKAWPNYGKLGGKKTDIRHCHLTKGKPTYVCCWQLMDKKQKIIEVTYVGTHEKAPY